jgi:hypothetical protein
VSRTLPIFVAATTVAVGSLCGQTQAPEPPSDAAVVVPLNEDRIFKVIPDYQTVENSRQLVAPMTSAEKWRLAWKEVIDPFNIGSAVAAAAMSQAGNETPKYGEGGAAYSKRVGAAIADFGSQNFLSAGVFACLLHQDPRYFRRGPPSRVVPRVLYSISRMFVTRVDSGRDAFNSSNILGTAAGIGLSNLYYPAASRTGSVMLSRVGTSLLGGVSGNLMSEFWPDIEKKLFQKKHK